MNQSVYVASDRETLMESIVSVLDIARRQTVQWTLDYRGYKIEISPSDSVNFIIQGLFHDNFFRKHD